MAKLKKYPKAPKAKASLDVWERYNTKCKDIDADNKKIENDKAKKAKLIQATKKLKAAKR